MVKTNLKYFNVSEFDSPDLKDSGKKMDRLFLEMINEARQLSGVPFIINSGFRTIYHNKNINGSLVSSHLKGMAADIKCTDSVSRLKIINGLLTAGFNRIGINKVFIHVDNDPEKPDCIWLY